MKTQRKTDVQKTAIDIGLLVEENLFSKNSFLHRTSVRKVGMEFHQPFFWSFLLYDRILRRQLKLLFI